MMSPEQCSSLHGFIIAIPLIETLHEMKPPLGGTTLEESALSSKQRQGYEECLNNLVSLANRGAQAPIQSPYVDVTMHDQPVTQEAVT
jgi:hypothetical protein